MRVSANQLVACRVDRVSDLEVTTLVTDLSYEHCLDQEVAEFIPQRINVAAINRVDNLVGLFNNERS